MKNLSYLAFLLLFSFTAQGQWVRPNQFTELDTVNDATFEVYSQRYGLPRKASLTTIKKFMDQGIQISGDSICITRASGTQCVKIPAQAFTQSSQSWSVTSANADYALPADSIVKYDYVFVKYEANSSTNNYVVTLPEPSINYNGKVVDVYLHLSSASGLTQAGISSANNGIQINDTGTPINQTNYFAPAGLYRFICTKSINASGYKWLLTAKPGSSVQLKRANAIFVDNTSTTFTSTNFTNTDFITTYMKATSANATLTLPTPDSTYLGKSVYIYPVISGYTAEVVAGSNKLLKYGTSSYTTHSTLPVTAPVRVTVALIDAAYYWEYRLLYNEPASAVTSYYSKYLSTTANYTIPADTVVKYDKVELQVVSSNNIEVTLPTPSGNSGKEIIVYPALSTSNVVSIFGSIARYLSSTSLNTYASIDITSPTRLVSNGTYWMWHPTAAEYVAGRNLVGRYSTSAGAAQNISLGSGFSWSGSTLNVTASGGSGGYSLASIALSTGGVAVLAYSGTVPTISTLSTGAYQISVPSGTSLFSYTISADTDDCANDGSIDIKVQWASLPGNINLTKDNVFLPAITVTEKITPWLVQQNDYFNWQVTHPNISSSSITTRITGINGFGQFIIKGTF